MDEQQLENAIQNVDSRRRGFISKLLAGGVAVAAIPAMSSISLGQDDDRRGGKGKGKGKGQQGKGRPSPEDLADRLLEEFDKDEDGKLNKQELVAALKGLMSRMAGGRGKGKGDFQGRGKGGNRGKGKGGRPEIE